MLRAIAGVQCASPGYLGSAPLQSPGGSTRPPAKIFDAELRFLAGHRQRHFRAAVLLGRPGAPASKSARCCVVLFPAPSHPRPERPRLFCPALPEGGLPPAAVGRLRALTGTDAASHASVDEADWAKLVSVGSGAGRGGRSDAGGGAGSGVSSSPS